jgi:Concanavalin A-like lectin/glucanases superfamily
MMRWSRSIAKFIAVLAFVIPFVFVSSSSKAAIVSCTPQKNLVLLLDARNARSNTGSGSTWKDISGCGLDATLYNSPTRVTDQGGAFRFISSSQQYGLTNSPGDLKPYTVEAYYKVDSYNSLACTAIVSDAYDTIVNGKINFTIGTFGDNDYLKGGAGPWTYTSGTSATFGSDLVGWHIATLTYDGTNMQFFYDSATVGGPVAFTNSSMGTNGTGINIAKRWDSATNCTSPSSTNNYFGGRIAVVKILNKALTSTEVQDEYRCITGGALPVVNVDQPGSNPKKQTANQVITASSNCAGSVTFKYNGKPINRCGNISTILTGSKYVASCSWKPIIHGANAIQATMNVNYYPDNASAISNITVLKRTSPR